MERKLLMGVEAIGQAAVDAGISGVYAYPGTPSTEIAEYIQGNKVAKERDIHRKWSANEKTALESALGMSYAGKRSLSCMKHVGLNVAADCFMNASITGVNGGMVIAVADDPSQHSSQNEQDSRYYGRFAMIPILEPSNQQEAYDMTYFGFEFSEKTGLPVLLRIPTRLAHSRSGVYTRELQKEKSLSLPRNPKQFLLLPAYSRILYQELLDKQDWLVQLSEESKFNTYNKGKDKSLGVICCGIAYNYLMENYPDGDCPFSVLKICQYPIPRKKVMELEAACDELLVLEDGYPIVEEELKDYFGRGIKVKGRLDGTLPRRGELNPDHVAKALCKQPVQVFEQPNNLAGRPPSLCQGCGHVDTYLPLNKVIEKVGGGRVFADIGCYTLGAMAPYDSIDTTVDMGASITMAKGAADAGMKPVFAVIGDSTFIHSGMTGLIDCVHENTNINVLILDNDAVAMTGGQNSTATGRIDNIVIGMGVSSEHLKVFNPLKKNFDEIVEIMKEEVDYEGVSVLIARRECIQKTIRTRKQNRKNKKHKK